MGLPDRSPHSIEQIDELDRRVEMHLNDPALDIETLAQVVALHSKWRQVLAANVDAMARLREILGSIEARRGRVARPSENELAKDVTRQAKRSL